MSKRSTYFFALPTWMEGVGRLVDFADTLTQYNYAARPDVADALATRMDWHAVGDDLRTAVRQVSSEAKPRS
ncbi:MAG: hypothetical protein M3O70_15200 [Actinomycetota bacterium]|nr:hypothetical protein [Actinomycetota bacterium]